MVVYIYMNMDLQNISESVYWLRYSSFKFNTENHVLLTNSLIVLQNENHFKKVFFWGVIHGLEADYYIAFGYEIDAIKDRKFFYSDDSQNWKLLPVPQLEHLLLAELCQRPFQGDPGLVIEVVDDAPMEEFSDEEVTNDKDTTIDDENKREDEEPISGHTSEIQEEVKAPITSGELKEEDRLAAVIHIITEETAIVPRGRLFKQTDGVIVHSQAFEGLQADDADELSSFQHYRQPQQEWNTNMMTRVDYNYAIDFLDTIDKDIPLDCWSAQLVEGDRTILLRNLAWSGFLFYHHLQTPSHGCIYVGSGQRSLDLPFMTQVYETKDVLKQINLSTSIKTNSVNHYKDHQPEDEKEIIHLEPEEILTGDVEEEILTSG